MEKRNIFTDDRDRFRFIHDLYEFNDINPTPPSNIRLATRFPSQCLEVRPPNIETKQDRREKIVNILAFCLMPNHFHLLIQQISDHGITRFMQKLGTGYTMYFNQRNSRVGSLFQGKFKAVLVQEDEHFRHLYNYIHLNPLDICAPEWRESKLNDPQKALDFLDNYRWSSHLDYTGKKNFPSIINKDLGLELFGTMKEYIDNIREWLGNAGEHQKNISNLILE